MSEINAHGLKADMIKNTHRQIRRATMDKNEKLLVGQYGKRMSLLLMTVGGFVVACS